jgi:AcrR family transcriptional regulator
MSKVRKHGTEAVDDGSEPNGRRAFPRLRPGPGLDAEQVASHQRVRLNQAMLQLVAEEGYESITVRKLARLAGVSTASFYARFDGKEDCFLASCGVVLARIRIRVQTSRSHEVDQRTQLTRTAEAFLAEATADPDGVRVALLDSFGGGPAALKLLREFECTLEADLKASLGRRAAGPSAMVTTWITAGWVRACRNLVHCGVPDRERLAGILAAWGVNYLDDAVVRNALVETGGPPAEPLPNGTEGFDERAAILAATAKLATSDGYWQLNPSKIRKQAGVSRAAFLNHFESAEDCYLTAAADLIRGYLLPIFRYEATPSSFVHQAILTLTQRLAAKPLQARFAFVGILEPGPSGLQLRERLVGELASAWHSQVSNTSGSDLLSAEATVSAFWRTIAGRIEANGTEGLSLEAPTLTLLLLAPSRRKVSAPRSDEPLAMTPVAALTAD